jgi:HlyD family secretion protein
MTAFRLSLIRKRSRAHPSAAAQKMVQKKRRRSGLRKRPSGKMSGPRSGILHRHGKLTAGLLFGAAFAAALGYGSSRTGTAQSPDVPAPQPGRIDGGSDIIALGTSATGTIAQLLVKPGDHVSAGQHLVRVECGNIEREVEARKSDLAAAEAVFERVLHGPRPEEIGIGVANVNLADARLVEAQKTLQRTQQLHEGFTVTRVQIDVAERDARIAAAQLEEMRSRLALLHAGSREEDIMEARARRDAAKSRVDEATTRLGYCSVDAPINGVVLSTSINAGQFVSATVPVTLLTMVDDSKRRVRTYVDEHDIAKLCVDQHAHVMADGLPGLQLDGTVEEIGAAVVDNPFINDPSRQFRQVILSVSDGKQQIPLGLHVMVQFSPCASAQNAPAK